MYANAEAFLICSAGAYAVYKRRGRKGRGLGDKAPVWVGTPTRDCGVHAGVRPKDGRHEFNHGDIRGNIVWCLRQVVAPADLKSFSNLLLEVLFPISPSRIFGSTPRHARQVVHGLRGLCGHHDHRSTLGLVGGLSAPIAAALQQDPGP